MITVSTIDSPIGALRVAARDGAVCAAVFPGGWTHIARALAARFPDEDLIEGRNGPVAAAFQRYFDGTLAAFDGLDLDLGGTRFQAAVWRALTRVKPGTTASYGSIARAAGSASAVRATGTATGANPAAIIVPCHRIVRSDGGIGGYGGGLARKRWLLEHEQRFTVRAARARR